MLLICSHMDELVYCYSSKDFGTVICSFECSQKVEYGDRFRRVEARLWHLHVDPIGHVLRALHDILVIILVIVVQALCAVGKNLCEIFVDWAKYRWLSDFFH